MEIYYNSALSLFFESEYVKLENVLNGPVFGESADGNLDYGTIIVYNHRKDKFSNDTLFKVVIGDIPKFYLCAEDQVKATKNEKIYIHQISLIEPTKILEKIIVNNLSFTNVEDDLSSQFEKLKINSSIYSNFKLYYTNSFVEKITGYSGSDFKFPGQNTLRDVFDEMLKRLNCRIKVIDINKGMIALSVFDYTSASKSISDSPISNYASRNNVDNMYDQLNLDLVNVSLQYPVTEGWMPLKSSSTVLNSNNASVFLQWPIIDIKEFWITNFDKNNLDAKLNIADYVVDKEYYNTLSSYEKDYHLFYERYSQNIDYKSYKELIFTYETLETIINKCYSPSESEFVYNGWQKIYFKIVYYPFISVQTTASKKIGKQNYSIIDGQAENSVDLNFFSDALESKINRISNDEFNIDMIVPSFSKLHNLLDSLENYVIYKREYALYSNYLKVCYFLSKDYNNLNLEYALQREKRIFAIPLESCRCILPIHRLIFLSTYDTSSLNDQNDITRLCMLSIMGEADRQFDLRDMHHNKVRTIQCQTRFKEMQDGSYEGKCYELPVTAFSLNNEIHLLANFYDNYSAGISVSKKASIFVGGKKIKYNPYVDENGEFTSITVVPSTAISPDYQASPLIDSLDDGQVYNDRSIKSTLLYEKDAYQSIGVEIIYEFAAINGVRFGSGFIKRNRIIHESHYNVVFLYVGPRSAFDNEQIVKTANLSMLTKIGPVEEYFELSSSRIRFKKAIPSNIEYDCWALIDHFNNIFLVVDSNVINTSVDLGFRELQ